MGLIERIQAKIELFRLEQRYTRRRHRRSTFVSNAIYVDGEYIYQSPNTTGSSANTSRTNSTQNTAATSKTTTRDPSPSMDQAATTKQQKRLNRWSSMPGFGSGSIPEGLGMPTVREQEWRPRVSFHDERRAY
jgi:activator of HSP90 ATPase